MTLVLLLILQGRTPGGHGLLEAPPRIYQVTPDIPDRRRATRQTEVRPQPADSLKESQLAARSGTISSASDVTDEPNQNSKPPSSSARRRSDRVGALPGFAQGRKALRSPASVRAGRAARPDRSRDVPRPARRREPHNSTSSGSGPAVPWPRHRPRACA